VACSHHLHKNVTGVVGEEYHQRMRKLVALPVVAIALVLTGCSASHPASSPKPTTYFGEDAAAIAGHITGCDGVKAGDVGAGAPALVSTATCTLFGHVVNVNSWADATSGDLGPLMKADAKEAFYASGTGWTVTLGDDPTLQMQFENDASGLLANAMNNSKPASANLDAQKTMANAVAKSLDGDVKHYTP
jgi:hypothetical protein